MAAPSTSPKPAVAAKPVPTTAKTGQGTTPAKGPSSGPNAASGNKGLPSKPAPPPGGKISPPVKGLLIEAKKAYYAVLQRLGIKPTSKSKRALEKRTRLGDFLGARASNRALIGKYIPRNTLR